MNKRDQVNALISYYSDGNKTTFATKLGLKPQSISNWIARNTFDADLIYSKCENISAEWLLTGEGEMLKSETPKIKENSGAVSDLEPSKIISELTEVIRTQAKALLEQQQFISAHFPSNARGAVPPPSQKGDQYAEKQ